MTDNHHVRTAVTTTFLQLQPCDLGHSFRIIGVSVAAPMLFACTDRQARLAEDTADNVRSKGGADIVAANLNAPPLLAAT